MSSASSLRRAILAGACLLPLALPAAATDAGELTEALERLAAERGRAVVARDRGAVEPLVARPFFGTGQTGQTSDRAKWFAIHFPDQATFTRFEPTRMRAWRLSERTAVLEGVLLVETVKGGETERLKFTSVYVLRDGRWRESVFHETRMDEPDRATSGN